MFAKLKMYKSKLLNPLSPKNLRIASILISIYEIIISHVILFLILLCLSHAQEMKEILNADTEELEDYVVMSSTTNEIKLMKAASRLVSANLLEMYFATSISICYVLVSLSLLVGVLKNSSSFMIPWLIWDFIGGISIISIMIWIAKDHFTSGKLQYWLFVLSFMCFDAIIWLVVKAHYRSLKQMSKLREVATIPIPCLPVNRQRNMIPYHYQNQNIYLSNGGLKHELGVQNYVV